MEQYYKFHFVKNLLKKKKKNGKYLLGVSKTKISTTYSQWIYIDVVSHCSF